MIADRVARRSSLALLLGGVLVLVTAGVALGDIALSNLWGWGTNVGWINVAPAAGGVTVCADHLEGYAWGENIGWIRLGTFTGCAAHTYANTTSTNYGVNRDVGNNLSGYAWGTNVGWLNFAPTNGGVTVDPSNGTLTGYAWSENGGWIRFDGTYQAPTPTPGPSPTPRPTTPALVGGFAEGEIGGGRAESRLTGRSESAPVLALAMLAALGGLALTVVRRRFSQ